MNILGISTSWRAWGNTDIMVKTALNAAKEAGAQTKMLNPARWELKPCTGCMSCMFKEVDCVIKDRFQEIIEGLRWADGVVVGSPTYILEGNSVLKNIQDRLLGFGRTRRRPSALSDSDLQPSCCTATENPGFCPSWPQTPAHLTSTYLCSTIICVRHILE